MTKIHPQLEKVARAIVFALKDDSNEQMFGLYDGSEGSGHPAVFDTKNVYVDGVFDPVVLARAAVRALMEPDDSMIDAGNDCYSVAPGTESWTIAGCKGSKQILRAMLLPLVEGEA